jgi:hypothetical protein
MFADYGRGKAMKMNRLAVVLTAINFVLLIFVLAQSGANATQTAPQTLRARAIELVDDNRQVRAQLNVEPNSEVVFRLRDAKGTIRVKLGASEDGSGLVLLDDATEPRVHALAKRSGVSLTLTGKDGAKRVIEP